MQTTTPRQNTLARAAELRGVGLHTGAEVTLRLVPAPVNTGIVFRRTDLEGRPEVWVCRRGDLARHFRALVAYQGPPA